MRADDPVAPDVLVVGGGPAGSAVAGLLAGRGWRVTLLDRARFPRPKACGECINPGGVRALARLGLLDAVEALDPRPLAGWDVVTEGGRRATGRFGRGIGRGLGVSRRRLDAALLDVARERGAAVEEGVRVDEVRTGGEGRRPSVLTRNGGPPRSARVVVGADGLRSVTARALGGRPRRSGAKKLSLTLRLTGTGPPDDRGRLVLGSGGTVGLAPVARGRWNATVVVDAGARGREVAGDPAGFAMGFVRERIRDWRRPPTLEQGPWGSGNFDFPVPRAAGGAVVLVGDAAGYYDPLTGQGIYRALRSAELAARAIDTALRTGRVSEEAEAYSRRLAREFAAGRRVQRLVEAVVSRPALRESFVGRLGAAPETTDALVRVTGDLRPARSLLGPAAWGPLLRPGRARPTPPT